MSHSEATRKALDLMIQIRERSKDVGHFEAATGNFSNIHLSPKIVTILCDRKWELINQINSLQEELVHLVVSLQTPTPLQRTGTHKVTVSEFCALMPKLRKEDFLWINYGTEHDFDESAPVVKKRWNSVLVEVYAAEHNYTHIYYRMKET